MITYEELTREQDQALEAPLDRPLVIRGPVGSGRSTVAVYRSLVRVAAGHPAIVVVPDLLRKHRLTKLADDRAGRRLRVITLTELPGVLLPGSDPVRWDDNDGWIQLTMRAAQRNVRTVSGGWAILFDDAHDQPVRAIEFARLFDPAVCVTVDPDVLVVGDGVGRRDVAAWSERDWQLVELGSSHRLLPAAARLTAALRKRPPPMTSNPSEDPVVCLVAASPSSLTGFVGELARRDKKQRIAVVGLRQHLFSEISVRLRPAVGERRYLPVFGGVTHSPNSRSTGPVVQLSETRSVRGNEFDVVVIAGLSDHSDRPDDERLADALARACGAARRAIYFVTEDANAPRVLSGLPGIDPATLQIRRMQDALI